MVLDGSVLCWGRQQNDWTDSKERGNSQGKFIVQSLPLGSHKIFCGEKQVVCLGKDGVYVWGDNASDRSNVEPMPVKLSITADVQDIKGIACGTKHVIIWTHEGLCYNLDDWRNAKVLHEPSLKPLENKAEAVLLTQVQHNTVVQVACGDKHTIFLYESGCVATMGENNHGQLGVGYCVSSISPLVLADLEDVRLISSGYYHCMAVTEAGELYCWGYGKAIGYKYKDIMRPTTNLSHFTNIVQLVGGSAHSLALTENGNVYSWGCGTEGQLGLGEGQVFSAKPSEALTQQRVCQIAASHSLSAALTEDGLLYLWGTHSSELSGHNGASSFRPLLVDLGTIQLCHIACGMGHMAAITGTHSKSRSLVGSRLLKEENAPDVLSGKMRKDNSALAVRTNSKTYLQPKQITVGHPVRKKTSIAEFYSMSEAEIPQEKSALPDSILLPGFKLPALLDASRTPQPISSSHISTTPANQRSLNSTNYNSLQRHSHSHARDSSSKSAVDKTRDSPETDQSSEEEVPHLLPMVTITKNQSRVTLTNSNKSHTGAQLINKSHTSTGLIEHLHKVSNGEETFSASSGSITERQSLPVAEGIPVGLSIPRFVPSAKEIESTNSVGAWNPHRNSIFNRNVFYKDGAAPNSGVNAKMIGFLDMSDIRLIDKPTYGLPQRITKSGETTEKTARHSKLYDKEMDMRNNRNRNRKLYSDKVVGHARLPFQKATRRSQVKHPAKASPLQVSPDRPQILFEKTSTVLQKLTDDPQRLLPSPSKLMDSLRLHYRSAPSMLSNSHQMRGNLAHTHPPTPDFSKAMTKFDLSNAERNSIKH